MTVAASVFKIKTIRDANNTIDLRYGEYAPDGAPNAPKKRYIVLVNGRTEWIEKYWYVPKDLKLPADCGVISWDHRGQGGSGGAPAFVDNYDSYAQDARRIIEHVIGDRPYALVCHSMGGLIGLYGTLKSYLQPQALVLASPLLGLPNTPVPRLLAKPLAQLLHLARLGSLNTGAGTFTALPFANNRLTHDVEHYAAMQKTPYPLPSPTFGWVHKTYEALDFVFNTATLKTLSAPTLVMAGSQEQVVDAQAFPRWVQTASQYAAVPIEFRLVTGARHELFSEIPEYYQQAIAATQSWLKEFLR